MRKLLFFCLSLLIFANLNAQIGYYYGSKFIELKPNAEEETFHLPLMTSNTQTVVKNKITNYTSKIYYADKSGPIIVLPRIIVKLNNENIVKNILSSLENKLSLLEQYDSIYYFDCKVKSSEEIFPIVHQLSKMNGIVWCEPDMCSGLLAKTSNTNPLYDSQYYLKYKGLLDDGLDINVESAWEMVSGNPKITVGVIDTGVDMAHEDLVDVVLPGYTVGNANFQKELV